jgi:hypothetical protein
MNTQLLDELIAMKQLDVDTRSRLVREGRLYDGYAEEMQHKCTGKTHTDCMRSAHSMVGQPCDWSAWKVVALPG